MLMNYYPGWKSNYFLENFKLNFKDELIDFALMTIIHTGKFTDVDVEILRKEITDFYDSLTKEEIK
jgi:hypothetical protein